MRYRLVDVQQMHEIQGSMMNPVDRSVHSQAAEPFQALSLPTVHTDSLSTIKVHVRVVTGSFKFPKVQPIAAVFEFRGPWPVA